MIVDTQQIVHSCEGCQFYAQQMHLPTQELQTIPLTWPFVTWWLDLLGPFKKAPRGYTHLLVTINKFTKWIEAKPITRVRSKDAV